MAKKQEWIKLKACVQHLPQACYHAEDRAKPYIAVGDEFRVSDEEFARRMTEKGRAVRMDKREEVSDADDAQQR